MPVEGLNTMIIRTYRDFVIYTDSIDGALKDAKGRPAKYSVRVFDSPVGEGEREEEITVPELHPPAGQPAVPDWEELEKFRTALAERKIAREDFEQFAHILGWMILPRHARDLFRSSLSKLDEDRERLRIRLRLLPELARMPWEYALMALHEGEPSGPDYWCRNPQISVVRHEMISKSAPPFRSNPYRRVIFAMASPPPYEKYQKLNLEDEQNKIKMELNGVLGVKADFHPDFSKEPLSTGTTVDAVEKALHDPADIFHFSGHGEYRDAEPDGGGGRPARGVLVFDSGQHAAQEVEADTLSGILAQGQIRLVVLDACETGQQDMFLRWSSVAMALLKVGIPAVVAMQFSIRDDMATEFSKQIYEDLVAGRTIDEAVTQGRLAMTRVQEGALDWGSPVLYMRNSGGIIFPPVTDERARQEAEESSQRVSILNEAAMVWTRKGMLASPDQLKVLQEGGESLKLSPAEAVLLLRSALESGGDTGYWAAQLRRVGGDWLNKTADAPLPQTGEPGREYVCLGLDGRILPPPPDGMNKLAWAAVRHPDELTAQTAALALLAQQKDQAVADIQKALFSIRNAAQRRRRRAMLIGVLAESDPGVEADLPQYVDGAGDRSAIWRWRARKHLRANLSKILRWTLGGALGGALALALLRGVPAFFSTHLAGTEFAVYSYWGFIAGFATLFGALLAAPLLLQDHGSISPKRRRRTAALAVLLGAAGFCLAGTLTILMNSYSFSLERVLRMAATSFLAGGGLSLGLIGQPESGWRLGAGGWLKRLAVVAAVLAVVQLPVLGEAAARADGSYYLPNARWLAAPIIESTQTLSDKYFFLNNLFPPYNADFVLECKRCCFDCATAAEASLAVRWIQGCFVQWLTVLDAALAGAVLTLGMILGMHFQSSAALAWLRKTASAMKDFLRKKEAR